MLVRGKVNRTLLICRVLTKSNPSYLPSYDDEALSNTLYSSSVTSSSSEGSTQIQSRPQAHRPSLSTTFTFGIIIQRLIVILINIQCISNLIHHLLRLKPNETQIDASSSTNSSATTSVATSASTSNSSPIGSQCRTHQSTPLHHQKAPPSQTHHPHKPQSHVLGEGASSPTSFVPTSGEFLVVSVMHCNTLFNYAIINFPS